jgi:enediyne biosynthesis protein E4
MGIISWARQSSHRASLMGAQCQPRRGDTCVARGAASANDRASARTGDTSVAPTLLALCLIALTAPAHAGQPQFTDATASSGLDSRFEGDWEFTVGGGVATFDCNGDSYPDVLTAGGTLPAKFYRNASKGADGLKFVAETSGLELDKVTGAYPLDVDDDGNADLVLLRVGENVIMRGLGGCRFERANEVWGFDGGDAWTAAFAATWEKGATWPTLAIGNYVDRKEEISPWGSCTDNWLHRPADGAKKFAAPLALKPSYCPLSLMFTDWNRSGTPSLRVSNDREYYEGGEEQMWHVEAGKPPALYTAAEGWQRLRIWGMGLASRDLDGDRYPEYFMTSMADNKLQRLKAPAAAPLKPEYTDTAYPMGITAHRPHTGTDLKPSTAWHAQFEDVDNDGLTDLFVAKGNVAKMPDFAAKDPDNLLIQQPDGKFIDQSVAAGVASFGMGRGAALTDFDLDGRVDILVINRWDKAELFHNTTASVGHWLHVAIQQQAPNRDAVGGWLEVRTGGATGKVQRRELTVGGGHASGQRGFWHTGLGQETSAEARVLWPDGTEGPWQRVAADVFYMLERSKEPAVLR